MACNSNSNKTREFTPTLKPDFCTSRMATMWEYQKDALFTDLIIKAKEKSIPCHKVVLAASCDYFASILKGEFQEGKPDMQISMENTDPELMIAVVKYLYGQNVSFNIGSLSGLLEVVEHLQLKDLKDQLIKFLSDDSSLESSLQYWKLSLKYGLDDLRKRSIQVMSSNVGMVGATDEFKGLSIEELLSIIRDDNLQLESRDELLITCIEWIDFEPLARKDHVKDIFENIKLEKCGLDMLNTIDKKYQDIIDSKNVYRTILNEVFRRYCGLGGDGKNLNLVVLGGMENDWDTEVNLKCLKTEQLDNFQWEQFAEIPISVLSKRSPIVCLKDGFLILCGGSNQKQTTKYDARNKSWNILPESPEPRIDASAVFCENCVYLLGGDNPRVASVYRLDLASLTWHQEADMLEKQFWPIAATVDSNIYVVHNTKKGQKASYSLQMFDAKNTKTWQYKSSLPTNTATHGCSLVPAEDALYLVGGYFQLAAQYKVTTDAWTTLKPPSIRHSNCSAALREGKIYVIGHNQSDHSDASVYDIEKNEWTVMPVNLPFKQVSSFKAAFVSWLE